MIRASGNGRISTRYRMCPTQDSRNSVGHMRDAMDSKLPRREFLKAAQAAAGIVAASTQGLATADVPPQTKPKAAEVTISSQPYKPVADYPITPKRYSEV